MSYTLHPLPPVDDATLASHAPLLRRLLLLRHVKTDEQADLFLSPDWERDTHDPFLMKDMKRVVTRLRTAMEGGETIAVWSDYDMDGIPGAALLTDFFRAVGYDKLVHHTPHRNKDGFGLNQTGLDELKDAGADLVITIDCGIGDIEQVAYANKLGIEVIVTDHHLPHETLPKAFAILNPKQKDCEYPEPMLCGAGVAFKLVQALLTDMRTETMDNTPKEGWEKWLLDMAGMSTIADMVPLTGENRALAYFGLLVLRKSKRPGLQALLKKARANQRQLTEDDVGFTIAPRVNAASRMGHASLAYRLLTTVDLAEAGTLAHELDSINNERKTVVATMKREIKRRLAKLGEPKSVIVLGNPEWKPSLLGLVAGGLAEEFERPVFLWGREEGTTIKGSCRSEGNTNVFEVMQHAKHVFIEYGGHAGSGGFSLEQEEVHALEEALIEAHKKVAGEGADTERYVDAELTLGEVTWSTYREVNKLAPFGEGNKKPTFLIQDVQVESMKQFGKGGEHLEVSLTNDEGHSTKAIAFFSKPDSYTKTLEEGARATFVVHLEASYFRYSPELRLRLVDVI